MLDTRTARTPIDLLEDGASPDLRDARMLAWLLDPRGEHGLAFTMLVALGACMAEKGKKGLSRVLASPNPPAFDTAVRLRAGQLEVVVTSMGHEMVGVWRARGRGYDGALERYAEANVPVIGIGRTLDAFPPETVALFPVFTWADALRVLDAAGPSASAPDRHGQLVASFRERLRARLGELAPPPPAHAVPPPPAVVPPPLASAAPPPRPEPAPAPAAPAAPAPAAITPRPPLPRPTGSVPRPTTDPRVVASRLLADVPGLGWFVPGEAPPLHPATLPAEGSLVLGADRKRHYLVHRKAGEGRQAEVLEVAIQGGDPFPGFEEEVETAVMRFARQGEESLLARERAILSRPHPGIVRLLGAEPGPPPSLVLERLVAHPLTRFGRVDPVTAVLGFVNMLELLQGIHDHVGVVLCSIEPGNIMLRMPGDVDDREYLARLAAGAWEPVLIDLGAALGDADLGEGGRPPLLAGDPLYLPPEAMPRAGLPGRYSRKVDVYALTLTLYEHLVGDRPYGRTDLHRKDGVEYLAELLTLKEKGTSPINAALLYERFEEDVAEELLEILKAGLASDPAQRRTAPELLELCRKKLRLIERRKAVGLAQYTYDADLGLHLDQRRLTPVADLRAFYAGA